MKRVTGIGGVFFKSSDPKGALAWYRDRLGIDSAEWGGFPFQWLEKDDPTNTGYTVWSVFPEDSKHMEPSTAPFMINFRVDDLEALMAELKAAGVNVVADIEQHENGKFAWITDPDGRKVELWEPVPSKDDPYI